VEALTGVKLPEEVIEASIVPGGVLHLRFREPKGLELGGAAAPEDPPVQGQGYG
jgi:hypothetical protein